MGGRTEEHLTLHKPESEVDCSPFHCAPANGNSLHHLRWGPVLAHRSLEVRGLPGLRIETWGTRVGREMFRKFAEDSGLFGGLRIAAWHGSLRGRSMGGHGAGAPSLKGLRWIMLVSTTPRRGAGLTTAAPTARVVACSHFFIASGENGWAAHR